MLTVLSNKDYKVADRLLFENSDHPHCVIRTLEHNVLPLLEKREQFLDIGPGPGLITNAVADVFTHTVIVEPNPEFHSYFNLDKVELIESTFQEASMENRTFDLVLCSHMLYHVPMADWSSFLDKAYQLLQPGGVLLVNMMAQRGYHHDFCIGFVDDYPSSRQVLQHFEERVLPRKIVSAEYSYSTMVFDEMHTLCRFFVLEDLFSPKSWQALTLAQQQEIEKRIYDYAAARKTPHGNYVLHHEGDYVIVTK